MMPLEISCPPWGKNATLQAGAVEMALATSFLHLIALHHCLIDPGWAQVLEKSHL